MYCIPIVINGYVLLTSEFVKNYMLL